VQKDSEVESAFVERLKADSAVVCFFKFPGSFKVRFPRIIGNYNPDWGIVRRNESGNDALYLVRETKGSEQIGSLRFPHEKRKVKAAYRYFAAIGADYRVVTDQTVDWWAKQDIEDQLRLS
jgi:type III restriction enzyme